MPVKVGRFYYSKSTRPGKKLMAVVGNKTIHFGAAGYEHYFDRTGLLPKRLNHKDSERRSRYHSRHSSDGNDTSTAGWHAKKILW